jgi:hypothetical protein
MKTEEEFWKYVDKRPDHWLWKGGKVTEGYGSLRWCGKHAYAHQMAWRFKHGEIPEGHKVCVSCKIKNCVMDEHLALRTTKEVAQMVVSTRKRHGRGPRRDFTKEAHVEPKKELPPQEVVKTEPPQEETKIRLSWEK